MALVELKSILSNFRKPFNEPRPPLVGRNTPNVPNPDETIPLSGLAPDINTQGPPLTTPKPVPQIDTIVESNLVVPNIITVQSVLFGDKPTVDVTKFNNNPITFTQPETKVLFRDVEKTRPFINTDAFRFTNFSVPEIKDTVVENNLTIPNIRTNPSVLSIARTSPALDPAESPRGRHTDSDVLNTKYTGNTRFTTKFINTSILNIDSSPQTYSGTTTFVPGFVNSSIFNIDTVPSDYQANNFFPNIPTSVLNFTGQAPTVNFFSDQSSGATGFTSRLSNIANTQYIGVSGPINSQTYTHPIAIKRPGVVNFFPNAQNGAKGFTANFNYVDQSQYLGIGNNQYTYPTTLYTSDRLMKRPTTNGVSTLNAQLGVGSLFQYYDNGGIKTKIFSSEGYSEKKMYGDTVTSIKNQPQRSLLYAKSTEQNSPSAIDLQYQKYNLDADSYIPIMFNSPALAEFQRGINSTLTLTRGIQRKGTPEPQRWGFGLNFDDGLIRSGATTMVERIAWDGIRIARFFASVKGLLWTVKQFGLQLSNPAAENAAATRVFNPIQLALNVGTSPLLGFHLQRHGLVGLRTNYEDILNTKRQLFDVSPGTSNRLIGLKGEVLESIIPILPGLPIPSLSSIGGPNSVYGIGVTNISRFYDSRDVNYSNTNVNEKNYIDQYAPVLGGFNKSADTINPSGIPAAGVEQVDNNNDNSNQLRGASIKSIYNYVKDTTTVDGLQKAVDKPKTENTETTADDSNVYDVADQYAGFKSGINATYSTVADQDGSEDVADVDENTDTGKISINTRLKNYRERSTLRRAPNGAFYKGPETYTPGQITEQKSKNTDDSGIASYTKDNTGTLNDINSLKSYITLTYGKIPDRTSSDNKPEGQYNNFQSQLDPSARDKAKYITKTDGEGKDKNAQNYYSDNNIDTRLGFGSQGAVGADRTVEPKLEDISKLLSNTPGEPNTFLDAVNKRKTFRGDKINIIDYAKYDKTTDNDLAPYNGVRDLIKFVIKNGDETYALFFRATITGLSDSFSPGWESVSIQGRPDPAYLYSSFERNITFNFTVGATAKEELLTNWRKLNYLSTYTMPQYSGGKAEGVFIRLTLGDMFVSTPCVIDSLSYTINDESPWETQDGYQFPHIVDVSIGLKIIGTSRPEYNSKAYLDKTSETWIKQIPSQ